MMRQSSEVTHNSRTHACACNSDLGSSLQGVKQHADTPVTFTTAL